jgi:hypothetical protein
MQIQRNAFTGDVSDGDFPRRVFNTAGWHPSV